MEIFALVAAFGGGLFGAAIGALPAFIFTGFVVIAGQIAVMAGVDAGGLAVGHLAFGSLFGPHIGFAGGVAAAAYAANSGKKLLGSGTDIATALFGLDDYMPLIIGGIFGILGYLINFVYAGVLGLPTDTVAMTVVTSCIIARFAFGKTGLTGKFEGANREWFPSGTALVKSVLIGVGMGTIVGGIAASLAFAGEIGALVAFPVVMFGISAASLILAQTGFAAPATHQITLPASLFAVGAYFAFGDPMAAMVVGIVAAVVASLWADVMGRVFNSHCDTFIDPPAMTIFPLTFLQIMIFPF